jgi:hypothetical protein
VLLLARNFAATAVCRFYGNAGLAATGTLQARDFALSAVRRAPKNFPKNAEQQGLAKPSQSPRLSGAG